MTYASTVAGQSSDVDIKPTQTRLRCSYVEVICRIFVRLRTSTIHSMFVNCWRYLGVRNRQMLRGVIKLYRLESNSPTNNFSTDCRELTYDRVPDLPFAACS
jgi:hypothetical protein